MGRARRLFTPLLGLLAFLLLRLLHATLRCRVTGSLPDTASGPVVFAFWHGEQQLILPWCRRRRVAVLTSASADGRLQAAILGRFGLATQTGSSSRGGAGALQGLVRRVRGGSDAALAVDGPRGPRQVAKAGAVQLARLTGAPIVPVRAWASRSWVVARSWDRFEIPKPFARVELRVLPSLRVEGGSGRVALAEAATELTRRLGDTRSGGVDRTA